MIIPSSLLPRGVYLHTRALVTTLTTDTIDLAREQDEQIEATGS